ncbi:MAG: flagellar basal body L-ring protein FlgH [Bdellovibrionales bacterium]|nr:flagellar basal body L-ring protein FlgH [Bdellovibrionales bacterium]
MIKDLAGTKKPMQAQKQAAVTPNSYEDNKNYQVYPLPERNYGRMDKAKFEQEAKVQSDAGSLWVDEGQGSYLFSQNQRRLDGDVLNVDLESQALEQLNSKVNVIADLLKKKEEAIQARQLASEPKDKEAAGAKAAPPVAAAKEKKEELNIKQVPTRVIATYPDGSYRVKGTKNIMIGNREFQVLVMGLVRGNDIANDSISSAKLLDSKFDIITNRKVQ